MSDEKITVYSQHFSVPGSVVETGLGSVRISYHPPGGSRTDWFHALDGGPRAGRRMGDTSDDPVRYSVFPRGVNPSPSEREAA